MLYGAFIVDDTLRADGKSSGDLPRVFLHPWNRTALGDGNLADMGAIAHRAGLPEAQFDEDLVTMGDWDLLVKLTANRDPLVLPAVACHYSSDAPDRLTCYPSRSEDEVRARVAEHALRRQVELTDVTQLIERDHRVGCERENRRQRRVC